MTIHIQAAYSIDKLDPEKGMASLRAMFPEAKADDLNFVLFSTSGTHGSYLTIEDVEASLDTDEPESLTVLVVQPRTVRMLYGDIDVTKEDVAYLKALRASSAAVLADYQ
jgi:hypothetical protein